MVCTKTPKSPRLVQKHQEVHGLYKNIKKSMVSTKKVHHNSLLLNNRVHDWYKNTQKSPWLVQNTKKSMVSTKHQKVHG